MMVIPENLPTEIAPLAWMLGQWKGWGMRSVDEGEDQPIYEEAEGLISGVQMKLVTRIYSASARESIDPVWDAATGVAALEIGDLMREETLYVSLLPGSGVLPEPGQFETREMVAQGAQSDGYCARWVGRSMGPRVQMETDALICDPAVTLYQRFSRMYGLVAGEMLWANEKVSLRRSGEPASVTEEAAVTRSGCLRWWNFPALLCSMILTLIRRKGTSKKRLAVRKIPRRNLMRQAMAPSLTTVILPENSGL